jgi:hypothetical protein
LSFNWGTFEMAQIARNQLQVVPQGRGRNLKIHIRKDCSGFFKMSMDIMTILTKISREFFMAK